MFTVVLLVLLVIASISEGSQGPELDDLARQVQMQQFHQEERIRSEGDSGVKQMRHRTQGTRNYHGENHAGSLVAAVHDHADWERHVGSGEFEAVLNGVEFKTRHNDYQLKMPSRSSRKFLAVEDVPFPPVPPSVLRATTVSGQISKMRRYFKAWKDGSISSVDFRPYFKPVLCYLEGAWTTQTKRLVDPFPSDRHFFDARTWSEMHAKIRYSAETGTKGRFENFAYCPTKIYDVNKRGAKMAQWLYRIVCHPLKSGVPLNRLTPIDELANRAAYRYDVNEVDHLRSTRYRLNVYNSTSEKQGFIKRQFIDDLMAEIPGLNNYKGKREVDKSFGITAHEYNGKYAGKKLLNAAYYHRLSSDVMPDAMDNFFKTRGFSDENLYMAKTSQTKVVPTVTRHCPLVKGIRQRCVTHVQRWSYAIPLEIIYLTPLSRWNPYNIKYRGHHLSKNGKKVSANGRDGKSVAKAYDGSNNAIYAITPKGFQTGGEINSDPADTSTKSVVHVLTSGRVRRTRYSGIRIVMPRILGVGVCRQRYPIMPIYADGNPIMKEVQALRELVFGILDKKCRCG